MTYSKDSPIVGTSSGTLALALSYLDSPDAADREYATELFRVCQLARIDPAIAFGQFCWETADATSFRWLTNHNPAGLAVAADTDPDPATFTGAEAARVHVWALLVACNKRLIANQIDIPVSAIPFRNRWVDKYDDPNCPVVRTIADLGAHYVDQHGEPEATWGWDSGYAAGVVGKINRIFPQEDPVPMSIYQIVGLPGPGIELPVPLSHQIIGLDQPNQRPGIARQLPGYWVQHETANNAPGADAAMHSRWLNGGADGGQVSFHFVVDDGAIYQMIPIDEVTWQAADGAGPGNMSGISCELCVNAGIDTAKARHNAEALCGGILKALGLGTDRIKRHWDFNFADPNRHHCPDEMMSEGYWDTFVANVTTIIRASPAPKPKPANEPGEISWKMGELGIHDLHGTKVYALVAEVTAKRGTVGRVSASAKAKTAGSRIEPGTKVVAIGVTDSSWLILDDRRRVLQRYFFPRLPKPQDAK